MHLLPTAKFFVEGEKNKRDFFEIKGSRKGFILF